jgi:catechol 2,3-dioxygenase-like lactoylglutathione lyase family enzyme
VFGAPYPLVEFQQVTIAVADLASAGKDWSEKLGWAPSHTSEGHVEFHLDGTALRLTGVDEGKAPGVGRVDVGVADLEMLRERLRRVGAAIEVTDGGVVVDPAATNGVQLVLHPTRSSGQPRASSQWRRINHLVVAVRDDEQAQHGWAELFGTWPVQQTNPGEIAHHVPVGRSWFGLTSAGSDAGPLEKFVERRGEGVYAIGVMIRNRPETISDLTNRGAELIAAGPQTFVHPRTTHGVLLDIVAG